MKKHAILLSALAGAAASTSPALADKELVESKEALDALWEVEFRPDYVDNTGDLPPIDTLDPGPDCIGPIYAGKQFDLPLFEQEVLGMDFAVSAAGQIGLVADATHLGAAASIGPAIKFGGLTFGGEDSIKPLDLRFEVATHDTGENSIDVSLYAFGRMIDTYTIASTSQPIEYIRSLGFSLPMSDFTGGWSDTFGCGDGCAVEYDLDYAAVAEVGAILIFRVSTAGVESGALAAVNAYAGATAGASWSYTDVPPVGIEHHTILDIMRAVFGARGRLVPHNGYWLADAAATLSIDDAVGAHVRFDFDIPDWIPLLPDVVSYTVFELKQTEHYDDWSYRCTFKKGF